MSLETMLIVSILFAGGVCFLYLMVRKVDKGNPFRCDHVSDYHRKISHNGFKSRMGVK